MNNQPKRRFYHKMPEYLRNASGKVKTYWKNLMHSTQNKLSIGAAQISRIITSAHRDNWRRRDDKHHHKPK